MVFEIEEEEVSETTLIFKVNFERNENHESLQE